MQRVAKPFRVELALGIFATEDFDADEAHRTGDMPAISTQFLIGLITARFDIHFDAPHYFDQKPAIDLVACEHVRQRRGHSIPEAQSSFPKLKQLSLFRWRAPGFVSDVIDRAAKVVKDQSVSLALLREATQRKGKIGFPCARSGGQLEDGRIHKSLSEVIRPS